MSNKDKEEYADEKFNTRSLLEAYNTIAQDHDTEFAEEIGQERKKDESVSGALMFTYTQMMDSYREGTIDAEIEASKNGENKILRTSFDQDLK